MTSLVEAWLDEDLLLHVLLPMLDLESAVALGSTASGMRSRLAQPLAALRAALPPPYSPDVLDAALASGDIGVAAPLLTEAMRRLRRNLETLSSRLIERGYPIATSCALSGRRYLAPMDDLEERLAAVRDRGLDVPLALLELWRALGGFALASPMDDAHVDWWSATAPAVAAHFVAGSLDEFVMPDPFWIDHGTTVLHAFSEIDGVHEYTLPVSFSEEEGFAFRTGQVIHLAPDAFHKRSPNASAASAPGTYAVWLDAHPPLDPELLRFTPPQQGELGGAEPLWRPQCSLMRYLRLAVLDAGGFPGCLGLEAYEPLRLALTEGLLPF